MAKLEDETRKFVDEFYFKNGPCCAGCDFWHFHSVLIGECHKSAPVSATERLGMIGLESISYPVQAGHIFTKKDHHCGDFKDEFDWSTLPKHKRPPHRNHL